MALVQLKLGKGSLSLDASSDLSQLAASPIELGIISDALDFDALLDQRVEHVAKFSVQPKIQLKQGGSWGVAGQPGALTVSIDAGESGTLNLIKPGDRLFKFPKDSTGADGKFQKARRGDQDCPYLQIEFMVKYAVSAGAKFSFGNFGVNGHASAGKSYALNNYFACDPNSLLKDAILAAFNAFVLPFNPSGAASMQDASFLDYVFSGRMAFGAGLTYGLSLGAASLGQLKSSFNSPIVAGGIAPSTKFGASLDVRFESDDAYRVIVGRQREAGRNLVNLCISRVDKKVLGLDMGIKLSASLGAKLNLQNAFDKVLKKAAAPLLQDLPDAAKAKALESFKKGLGQDQIDQYIKEAQQEIDNFLDKVNKQNASFTAAYEQSHTDTQLFNYVMDCNIPEALNIGYPAAMKCDYHAATQAKGVDLQPGSFLEGALSHKTVVTLQVFNLFKAVDTTEFFQNLKTVYAGGGIFRVIYTTGVDWASVFNGRSEDLKVFFEATSKTHDQVTFQGAEIALNFVITDRKDSKRAALTAKVLRALGNQDLDRLAHQISDTVTMTARIHADAFAALKFDPVRIGKNLNAGSHENDRRNYETFVGMVNTIRGEGSFAGGLFPAYNHWVVYNQRANDQEGPTRPPDREDSGNLNTDSVWPAQLNVSSFDTRKFISIDFEAGRQFMNFCEFLDRLDDINLDEDTTGKIFDNLVKSLSSAIRNSSMALTWYSKASFLALARLLSAHVVNLKGPASQPKAGDPFTISFELE